VKYNGRGDRDSATETSITANLGVSVKWQIITKEGAPERLRLAEVQPVKLVRMPPVMSQRIGLWFVILEGQFATASITDDDTKFTTFLGCLETRYLERIEDILMNPPAIGRYEKLKNEIIRVLADSDSAGVKRLVESEKMSDRKAVSILSGSKTIRHSLQARRFHLHAFDESTTSSYRARPLAAVDDTSVDKLTRATDHIEEA
jgi:hypothetical protein